MTDRDFEDLVDYTLQQLDQEEQIASAPVGQADAVGKLSPRDRALPGGGSGKLPPPNHRRARKGEPSMRLSRDERVNRLLASVRRPLIQPGALPYCILCEEPHEQGVHICGACRLVCAEDTVRFALDGAVRCASCEPCEDDAPEAPADNVGVVAFRRDDPRWPR